MCDFTQWLYQWHHTLCLSHMRFIWHHTQCYDNTTIVELRSHYVWYHTHCIYVIPGNLPIWSHPVYVWHHSHYRCDIICTKYDITSTLYDITPLYWWHQAHYIWHHIPLSDLTFTVSVSSLPLCQRFHSYSMYDITYGYVWPHIHSIHDSMSTMYDITTLCIDDTAFAICMTSLALQMTSHPPYHTKPQYLWCHIHFRHDITPTGSDIAPSVSLSSHPLHWYHSDYMCDKICNLYNITTTSYVFTLLYLWHHNLDIWNHIRYIGQHIDYPCDITPTNLCHYPHCIDNITPTLCMTSHSAYVWHLLPYTRYHILTLWHRTTVFMTSHPLYFTLYPLYQCHHIHCFDDTTLTVFMRSHLLYMTTSRPLYVTSQCICVIAPTLLMISHPFMYDITPIICITS